MGRRVGDLVKAALETAKIRHANSAVDARAEIAADLPCCLLDSLKVDMILVNLLENALKFTDAGEVVVGACWRAGTLSIEVRDTGKGISPESRARIFEAFIREQPGTGPGPWARASTLSTAWWLPSTASSRSRASRASEPPSR